MIEYDLKKAKRAVQYLVDTTYFGHHLRKVRSSVAKPRAMPFKDEAEPLNELLRIGRQNLQAMENLIEVAQFKRDPKHNYQKEFMAAKRQRDMKVIKLEELLQGKRLSLEERRALLLKQYDIWNKEKNQYLKEKGDLAWKDRNAAIKLFWLTREQDIEQLIIEASKAQEHFRKHKRVVEVPQKPPKPTLMREAMKKALTKSK